MLIDVGGNGETRNNLDIASGGIPQPVGFIGFPQPPLLPNPTANLIVSNRVIFIYYSMIITDATGNIKMLTRRKSYT